MLDSGRLGDSNWQVICHRCLLIFAALSLFACDDADQVQKGESSHGNVRTIRVLSTRDDSPIPGVNVEVRAVMTLGEFGPTTDIQMWNLITDAEGEVHLHPLAGTKLEVYVSGKPGFTASNANTKHYENNRGPKLDGKREANVDIYYLTPTADVDLEWVRYAFRAAADVVDGKTRPTGKPIVILVNMYSQAKEHAKSERELAELREFCRFSQILKTEAESGWPTLGTTEAFVNWGKMLINDCAASAEMPKDPSALELPAAP